MRLLRRLFRWSGRYEIFRFRRDGRWVYRDPVIIRRRLIEHGGENWPKLVDAVYRQPLPSKLATPEVVKMREASIEVATAELVQLVSKAFEVKPLAEDGKGMTESQRIDLMGEFLSWCADVVEETRPLAFTSPVTEAGDGV